MDSKDRPESHLPAVPVRISTMRPALLDSMPFAKAAEPEPAKSVNLLGAVYRAVTRHWWQILLIWGVGTFGAWYVISAKVKPLYEAQSMLKVEPAKTGLFGSSGNTNERIELYLNTQVQLIKSQNVISAVLSDPRMASQPSLRNQADADAELLRLLMVQVVPETHLLIVSMNTPSPTESAELVNGVVAMYLKASAEWTDGMTRSQIKGLETYQRQLQAQIEEKKSALFLLSEKATIDPQAADPMAAQIAAARGLEIQGSKRRMTMEEYKQLNTELLRTNLDLNQAQALLEMKMSEHSKEGGEGNFSQDVNREFYAAPEVKALTERISRAQKRYKDAKRLARYASDASVVHANEELQDLTQQFEELAKELKPVIQSEMEGKGGSDASRSLARVREDVQTLRAKKKTYEDAMSRIEVINRQQGSDDLKALLYRQDLTSLDEMNKVVQKRLEEYRLESQGSSPITLINKAKVSMAPKTDNRKKFLMIAPIGLFMLVLGLFVALEVKIGRVSDLEGLSKQVPVEVFALPPLPGPRLESGQRGAREREARLQEFLQSLDHLRVSLCDDAPGGTTGGRCLVITSATTAEGKTTLSAQLAACCAKAGISTLLIDADMRRATLSRMLNEEKTPGLSDVLQGDLLADDAAVAIPDAGFHLLPAGSPGRDPSFLLKGQRVGQLMARYRQLFDLILIDTPPVLPVPDALTLGRWTDGAVLSVRFDISRLPLVDQARRRIVSAGIPLLKTVVNGVKTSRFSSGYSGFLGYGYGGYGGYASGDRSMDAVNPPEPQPTGHGPSV